MRESLGRVTTHTNSLRRIVKANNMVDPSLSFVAESRNKLCHKLEQIENVNIPSKTVYTRLQDGKVYLGKWVLTYVLCLGYYCPLSTIVT